MADTHETRKAILASLFNKITIDEWLDLGISENFCGSAICYTHNSFPVSDEEDNQFAEGNDPCMHMVRLHKNDQPKDR